MQRWVSFDFKKLTHQLLFFYLSLMNAPNFEFISPSSTVFFFVKIIFTCEKIKSLAKHASSHRLICVRTDIRIVPRAHNESEKARLQTQRLMLLLVPAVVWQSVLIHDNILLLAFSLRMASHKSMEFVCYRVPVIKTNYTSEAVHCRARWSQRWKWALI